MAIASLLTEPLVKLGREVEIKAGEVERVMGALTATESAMDRIVVGGTSASSCGEGGWPF